jgi:cell division protein ZapE
VLLVITSNQAPHELYRDGLQRSRFLPTIALLEHRLEMLARRRRDYRLRQLQRAPIYLDSRAADSAARLQRLFTELAGESGRSRTEVHPGPQLCALCAQRRRGLVRLPDLCEGLAARMTMPTLHRNFAPYCSATCRYSAAPEQDDAARRFIALVDEFYDQGTKLVLSAAAAPAELYRGERLQLEFQRTASRLIEMQSAAYLARSRPCLSKRRSPDFYLRTEILPAEVFPKLK